jgi:ubiquinone/menaquinone biosynthesis C-methylase UbiE
VADPLTRQQRPGWLLDELASAGRENLDDSHVSRYDLKMDADAFGELALLQRLGLNGESVVVDMGTGTGQFALAAAPACARVFAVDVSPLMLDVLHTKVRLSGTANIQIVQSGFLTYEHGEKLADFVYSRFALHHLPDFWKAIALKRIRRLLRPGGVFRLWDAVYSFELSEAEDRLEAWAATLDGNVQSEWTRADIEEHIRDEHSTFTWLLEPMMLRSGFELEDVAYSADGIYARYVARAT